MRPGRAVPLTPSSPTPAFPQNVAKSCVCHTSENSPVTPIIATDPKTRSRKSCVCHTCDPLPPPPFHFSSSFSRHESLATSKFPRSWSQICPFIFRQLQDAPPATLFFSCFCMVAGGGKSRRHAPVRTRFSFKNPCTVSPPSFPVSGAAAGGDARI